MSTLVLFILAVTVSVILSVGIFMGIMKAQNELAVKEMEKMENRIMKSLENNH